MLRGKSWDKIRVIRGFCGDNGKENGTPIMGYIGFRV